MNSRINCNLMWKKTRNIDPVILNIRHIELRIWLGLSLLVGRVWWHDYDFLFVETYIPRSSDFSTYIWDLFVLCKSFLGAILNWVREWDIQNVLITQFLKVIFEYCKNSAIILWPILKSHHLFALQRYMNYMTFFWREGALKIM